MNNQEVLSAKVESVDSVTVASSVLADLIGVTKRRIRQLTDEGILIRVSKGRYDLAASVKNYIIHLKANNDIKDVKVSNEYVDLDHERALHERIKREQSELKLALMKGDLHKAEDVEKVMSDMLTSFRSRLLNLPAKIAPMLVARNEVGFIEEMMQKEMTEVLNELKNYNPQEFYGDEYIDFEEESGVEEDHGEADKKEDTVQDD